MGSRTLIGAAAVFAGGILLAFFVPRSSPEAERVTAPKQAAHETAVERPVQLAPLPPEPMATNTRSADYDAAKLLHAGVTPDVLFDHEVRDPAWAPAMERSLKELVLNDVRRLAPDVQVEAQVECRRMACRLWWPDIEDKRQNQSFTLALQGALIAPSLGFGHPGSSIDRQTNTVVYAVFSREIRSPEEVNGWRRQALPVLLERLRNEQAQGKPNPFTVSQYEALLSPASP